MKPLFLGIVLFLVAGAAAAQRNVEPAIAEMFLRAYAGKWTDEGCDNPKATYVAFASRGETELMIEFRLPDRLLANNFIALDSLRYLGAADGLHRFAYRVESQVPGQARNAFDVMMETDGATRRRTYSSVRASDGAVMIRDGKLANGQTLAFLLKCGQAK